ncbi:MAG TPA: hypothetical protein VFW71_13520 [Actinomycetota bacterium]|nr:hypothetical protein [Actinomycetota bacterium]
MPAPEEASRIPADQIVRDFLHAQNLEQVGKAEEAVGLYEEAVAAGFDAAGPYDRLIFIYQQRRAHRDVIRVCEASLRAVRTYEAKRTWYRAQMAEAEKALGAPPAPTAR